MSAVITNNYLMQTENSMSEVMERLSSGFKINRAKDDPAGMAISNKMQAQIDGLAQASQNASNGNSVLQIADSAISEITSMLQRMRELSVAAATDTYTPEDKKASQEEIESLTKEVDRISRDTEYNTKTLLDGSSDVRVYANDVSRMSVSNTVKTGDYKLTVDQAATQDTATSATMVGTIPAGKIMINGVEIEIEAGDSPSTVYTKLRNGAEMANVTFMNTDGSPQDLTTYPSTGGYTPAGTPFAFGDNIAFVSNVFGQESDIRITCDNPALETFLGLDAAATTNGVNMEITLDNTSAFSNQASVTVEGNRATITDMNGFKMDFSVDAGKTGAVDIEVTDIGSMTLQIGANENQTMKVRIPEISSTSLYLDEINVTKVNGGSKAMTHLDKAISSVTAIQSQVGAYENRLDHAVDSLDASGEDMTSAIARIKDADMAKEMTEYTKYKVLDQAAISVLAQANDIPQTILQLLQ